jgi:hypothetical protein
LEGGELAAGMFTFELMDGPDVVATASNDADGNIIFNVNYTREDIGKTFTYEIVEKKRDNDGSVVYDTSRKKVQVKVTESTSAISTVVSYPQDNA